MNSKTLLTLQPGEAGIVERLSCTGSLRRRLLDIGLLPGAQIVCVGCSPCKDPKAYLIRGAVIALRATDSRQILLKQEDSSEAGRRGARESQERSEPAGKPMICEGYKFESKGN